MWLLLAFLSATLLGFYDVFKKKSLKDNAVLPVLFLNTFFSSLIFLPFILISVYQPDLLIIYLCCSQPATGTLNIVPPNKSG